MNGLPAQIYLWLLSGAIGLIGIAFSMVGVLFGFAVRTHIKADEDFKRWVEAKFVQYEDRLHRYRNQVNEIATRQRWADEDKAKGKDQ